jgi:hypothetical protein
MKRFIIFVLLLISFGFCFNVALADNATINTGSSETLTNPLGDINTPQAFIGKVINSILGVVGSLALLMFVYGGLIWMTSSGNQEKVKKGRDTLMWAAIGLVIIFSAYGLTRFIIGVAK